MEEHPKALVCSTKPFVLVIINETFENSFSGFCIFSMIVWCLKHSGIAGVKKEDDAVASSPLTKSLQDRRVNCDRSQKSYDLCTINAPTVLDPTTSSFHVHTPFPPYTAEKIRPYPRKWEPFTMNRIKELYITSGRPSPPCKARHSAPAIVFSAGGYTGNFFHDFNDGFVPIFITVNTIFPNNQDFVFVISKARRWWVSKYADLLRTFSNHPIVDLDNDNSTTHCFPSATLGVISHGFMKIDPALTPNSVTFRHFRAFLDRAYNRGQNHHSTASKSRPRLVLASRSGGIGRVILNQNDLKRVAEEVGFQVIVFEPTPRTPLHQAYGIINSSDAMVGVHGAALTHSLFLRRGSVLIQVVPIGAEWVAEACFGNSAKAMGLEYMEYRMGEEESSLVDKYSKDSLVLKDPVGLQGNNWSSAIMDIYLKEQNVRLDLVRFRKYLKKAYLKAKMFMNRKG
ncbi:hypothetical protein K2173_017137 [Erythroxylum novogranatense]|uniref:Glycosyltransferase 61 catalytic domain-containing protein n=1 Tax=Erythroxylum novogranatense TaxID=1862640 RepID=A0AAV8U715_9ROSI|nr:hypothetical protein K2173_017137 [Erythroxylum novogranatense]